jgi:hypothetical protein
MNKTRRTLALAGLTMAAGAAIAMSSTAAYAAPADGNSTFTVTSVQDGPGDHRGGDFRGGPGDDDHRGDFRGGPGDDHRGDFRGGWDRDGRWVMVGTYSSRTACNVAGWWLDRHDRRVADTYCVPGRGRSYVLFAKYFGRGR